MRLPAEIGTLVIGGGIVGMTAALALARAGADVCVIDDGRHSGTTANAGSLHVQMQSRFLRMYPEQAPNLEASLPLYPMAVKRWNTLAAELGADFGIKASGGLMVAEDRRQFDFLAEKCARERALGIDAHMLERAELERVAPYLGEAVIGAEFCVDEGKVDPLLANQAIRKAMLAAGVVHAPETRVTAIEREGSGHRAETTRGAVCCGRIVLSAGAGTGALARMFEVTIPTTAEPLHVNVTEATGPLIHHLVQHADRMITMKQLGAGQVVIGGGWPATFTGENAFPTVLPESLLGNLSLAIHVVPRLARLRLVRTWSGVNTTADGQCILGALPGHANVFAAVPGDAGYTLGPLVGEAIAAIVLGREPGFDVERFGPGRFS